MTLRAKVDEAEVEREKERKVLETIHLAKFTQTLIDIKQYLIRGYIGVCGGNPIIVGVPIIVVNTDVVQKQFVKAFQEEMEYTIYSIDETGKVCSIRSCGLLKMKRELKSSIFWWSRLDDQDRNKIDDLEKTVKNYLCNAAYLEIYNDGWEYVMSLPSDSLRHYIIFWNLFLAAMDDDIYNEQLSTVAALAACFGFDEPMMRDWCRAVEYVFAGNKLREDCDLECETVEGARFFLHKEA